MTTELKPREKMKEQGTSVLSTKELLALILGKGSKNKNIAEGRRGIYNLLISK